MGMQGGAGQSSTQPAAQTPPNMFQQASQATTGGMAGAAREMGFQPMMVGAGGTSAAQTSQADINRFYNPYTSQVIDTTLADIEKARLQQQNAAAAQATAAGAFGGSRGALMEAQIGSNALEQAARTAAQLRSQGFTQAANLAQQDVARRQQTGQFNAQQGLQAALSNQAAQLAGSQQRLSAGNQLANIGNLGFGQAQSVQQNMQQQGMMQQALQQQLINAAQGQYSGYTGFPAQSLGYISQALGATQIPQSQTTSRQPGLFDYLTLGMMM